MTEAVSISAEKAVAIRLGRWWQLSLGVICMSMIANLQYGWTLFVNPIHDAHGWSLSAIQVAFTIFVLVETWLVPIEGYLVDRIGPRLRRRRGRHSRRAVVGDQLRRRHAADALPRRGRRRHRRGRGVRRVRRQRAQVVSRPARARGRTHGDGIRRGLGADGLPDREHDQVAGLRGDVLQVRHRAGRRRVPRRLVPQGARRAVRGVARHAGARNGGRSRARVHADRDAPHAGVLGDVRDVRADGDRRPDRDGAADADREGLRRLGLAGVAVRRHAARASLRAVDESRAERREPARSSAGCPIIWDASTR